MGFPTGPAVKNPPVIQKMQEMPRGPSLEQKLSGRGHKPLAVFCLTNPMDLRSLTGYSVIGLHRVGHDGND